MDQSSNWGEYLKTYETQKKTLGWNKEEFTPAPRMSSHDIAVKQREVDPVTMVFRDSAREEERLRVRTAKDEEKRRNWNQLKQTQRNILVNRTSERQQKMYETMRQSVAPAPPRERNIVSHLNNGPDHTNCPTIYNDQYMTNNVHVRATKSPIKDSRERDFNLISNVYVENDTARKLEEHDVNRDYIRTKYSQVNILDPIKMEYYDEARAEIEDLKQLSQTQDAKDRKIQNLPPSTKYSEGRSYNILNPVDVTDVTGLNQVLLKETMRKNRSKKLQVESRQRASGEVNFEKQENRRMKRVNYARVKYQLERGYDPINLSTNLKAPTAFGTAPPTMWSRFHRDESSEGFTGIGTNTLSDTRRTPAAYSSGMGRLLSGRSSPTTGANMTSSINSNVDSGDIKGGNVSNQRGDDEVYSARASARESARASVRAEAPLKLSTTGASFERVKANLPPLDLSKASIEEKVTYDEGKVGPSSMPIPMVRTGSMLSMR